MLLRNYLHMPIQDGGSLDLIMKRGGRIPVDIIRSISIAVSCSNSVEQ